MSPLVICFVSAAFCTFCSLKVMMELGCSVGWCFVGFDQRRTDRDSPARWAEELQHGLSLLPELCRGGLTAQWRLCQAKGLCAKLLQVTERAACSCLSILVSCAVQEVGVNCSICWFAMLVALQSSKSAQPYV